MSCYWFTAFLRCLFCPDFLQILTEPVGYGWCDESFAPWRSGSAPAQLQVESSKSNVEKPHKPSVVLAGLQERCQDEHEANVSQAASVSSEPRQPSNLDCQQRSEHQSSLVQDQASLVSVVVPTDNCSYEQLHCEVIGDSTRAKSHNSENTHQVSWRILKCLNWFVLYLLQGVSFLGPYWSSAHGDGHINPQVTVVCEQMCDGGVKHQTVTVHDGGRHAVMDGAGRGLPGEPPPVAVEL